MQTLWSVKKDLCKLQIQANRIQEGIRQVSGAQTILTQGSTIVVDLERTMDLRVIPLPEGSICIKPEEDRIMINIVKDIGMNLVALLL